jgi:hypothetical protein
VTTTPPVDTDKTKAVTAPAPAAVGPRQSARPAPASTRPPTSGSSGSGTPRPRRPVDPGTRAGTQTAAGSTATRSSSGQAAPSNKRVMGYRRQRFEARKVRRLVRHIDPWSILKLAVLVSLCMWFITMIASVILWTVAQSSGTISSIENFVNSSLQLQDWKLDGEFLFRQFGLITLLLFLGFAASIVVASLVFNLISDIIGGVWISVIEEETARPVAESRKG